MIERSRFFLLAILFLFLTISSSEGQTSTVLVNEQFNGSFVDTSVFTFSGSGPESFFGRTQLNSPSLPGLFDAPPVSNGSLMLRLNTFNPFGSAAGNLFLADEIRTIQQFAPTPTTSLTYEIRARFVDDAVNPLGPGLVGGLFTFGVDANFPNPNERDEVDFELLSNFPDFVLTNVFDDQGFSSAGSGQFANLFNLDPTVQPSPQTTDFIDYRLEVSTSSIDFFINDVLVRSETSLLAIEPQDFRLNINAPDQFFASAFSADLQPTANPDLNETFILEVDSLVITETSSIPEPAAGTIMMLSGLALLRRRRSV